MKNQIICVYGASNTGKSTALREMCRHLLAKGATDVYWQTPNGEDGLAKNEDIVVSMTYRGIRIGIQSHGDVGYGAVIQKQLQCFKELGCELILAASRTRGATCDVIRSFCDDYEINWFSTFAGRYIDKYCLWNDIEPTIEQLRQKKLTLLEQHLSKPVWKFGCRWNDQGTPDPHTKKLFKKYQVAFVYTSDVKQISKGDYLVLMDGLTSIAIGIVTSSPASLVELTWSDNERNGELKDYIDDSNVFGCRVQYFWLDEAERFSYEKLGMFCNAIQVTSKVNDLIYAKMKKALQ